MNILQPDITSISHSTGRINVLHRKLASYQSRTSTDIVLDHICVHGVDHRPQLRAWSNLKRFADSHPFKFDSRSLRRSTNFSLQLNMGKTVADTIGDIEIEKIQGPVDVKTIPIKSLWENQGVVVHFLRRFGCQLCRGHARELEQIVPTLEAKGFRVVAIGIEKLGLDDFQAGNFWKGELYIDDGKNALKALNVKQLSILTSLKDIALNKEVSSAWKKTRKVPGNYKGDGRQLGATFVFAKGGETLLDHRQKNFGDHASNEDILKAADIDPTTVPATNSKDAELAPECDMICS